MSFGVLRHEGINGGAVGGGCWQGASRHSAAQNKRAIMKSPCLGQFSSANVAGGRQLGYENVL
jgi:hypothetical protein